jgi:cell division protein FtsI/penicillin-binding protein 2
VADTKTEPGFFKKLFGKKSNCCSFQVEEIQNEPAETVEQEIETSCNTCCSTRGMNEDKSSD